MAKKNKKPKKRNITKKTNKSNKTNKPKGHFCRVCGKHKSNESFTGRGHANHMCKTCSSRPVSERNKMMAVRRAENMAYRYLNEQEIKWLRKKMKDPRPEVREAACASHRIKFPRQERNMTKKGLTAFSLKMFIRGEVWNEYCDEILVHMLFTMERDGIIRKTDYNAPESDKESEVIIDKVHARKFLKSIIHEYDALFWNEDFSDADYSDIDPYLDVLPEYHPGYYGYGDYFNYEDIDYDDIDDDAIYDEDIYDVHDEDMYDGNMNDKNTDDEDTEDEYTKDDGSGNTVDDIAETKEPIFSLTLKLNNGEERKIVFYNQLHDEPQELFWAIMDLFETDLEIDTE